MTFFPSSFSIWWRVAVSNRVDVFPHSWWGRQTHLDPSFLPRNIWPKLKCSISPSYCDSGTSLSIFVVCLLLNLKGSRVYYLVKCVCVCVCLHAFWEPPPLPSLTLLHWTDAGARPGDLSESACTSTELSWTITMWHFAQPAVWPDRVLAARGHIRVGNSELDHLQYLKQQQHCA